MTELLRQPAHLFINRAVVAVSDQGHFQRFRISADDEDDPVFADIGTQIRGACKRLNIVALGVGDQIAVTGSVGRRDVACLFVREPQEMGS